MKSNALKMAEGRRDHNGLRPEQQHVEGSPDKPEFEEPRAAEIWDQLIATIDPRSLRMTDAQALATLCRDEARLEEGYRQLNRMKDLFTSTKGRQAMKAIQGLANRLIVERREFGLTPQSRTRISTVSKNKSDTVNDAIFDNRNADLFVLPKAN